MSRRLRIIVAAPEADTREYLFDLLHGLGHDVACVGGLRPLLELCASFEPDLVLGGAGLKTAKGQSAVPFVLVGGAASPADVEEALALADPPARNGGAARSLPEEGPGETGEAPPQTWRGGDFARPPAAGPGRGQPDGAGVAAGCGAAGVNL